MYQIVRDAGRNKEPRLFERWRGKHITRYFSHWDTNIESHIKSRYHRILREVLPEMCILSKTKEVKDPAQADKICASCTHYLREVTPSDQD